MEKITWDASYSIGVPQLDAQHQKLIAMINTLIDTPNAEYSSEIISDLLSKAINYALEHFKSEEDYMEAIHYPGIVAHKKEHKRFILKMANESVLVMQKKEGPTDLLTYLKAWLTHHILYSDMKYMKYHAKRIADQKISLQLLAKVS